ncbi:hypothetical protein RhiLY_00638 [Ceratobasidium sp. AG-Ba]|nr:hypothetical protein RhiLY_00638 [Ceratobasidium sp. AG-Ba]
MESEAFSAQATLAHYWDDAPADTLTGVKELPTVIASQPNAYSTFAYGLIIAIAIYCVVHYAKASLRSRREKIAQLELRRRHGIPDSDTRPFNIAYHAASIAARDAKRQSMSAQPEQQLSAQNTTSSTNVIEGFRPQGSSTAHSLQSYLTLSFSDYFVARARPPIPSFPGQPPVRVPSGHFTFAPAQPQPVSNLYTVQPAAFHTSLIRLQPRLGDPVTMRMEPVPLLSQRFLRGVYGSLSGASERRTWSSAARPVPTSHSTGNLSQARVRKRLYLTADEEADDQRSGLPNDKRSRTAGWGSEAMIDGDNEPLWAQSYPVEAKPAPEQYEPETGKTKGKRLADDADGDLRTEGKRRHTKSKSHRPKPSAVQETRGTKRERKDTDTASALNDVMPVHKRGRAGDVNLSMVQEEDDAEEEDDLTISRDPLCGGRRIGQKWTANGQEYMVAPMAND